MIALIGLALASIEIEGPLAEATEVTLRITESDGSESGGETVRVTHHPGTPQAFERAISITDARGRVTWTPETSGIAELRAGPQVLRVRVERSSVPTTPLAVLVILCVAGVLGAGWGFRRRVRA
ncbi:MAG: hypothetical protein H6734_00675 [Alphaproteobacteria bacterium]|nr:hypothetical protein [Alphaproteobacteria bacterium]